MPYHSQRFIGLLEERSFVREKFNIIVILIVISFLVHFVWEMWQIPFYRGMVVAEHWSAVVICSQAAIGDGIIAVAAYSIAALTAKDFQWLRLRVGVPHLFYLLIGLVITAIFEVAATGVLDRWQYSDMMPTLPVIEIGLIPLLQWLLIPPVVLWSTAVFLRGLTPIPQRSAG